MYFDVIQQYKAPLRIDFVWGQGGGALEELGKDRTASYIPMATYAKHVLLVLAVLER